MTGVAAVLVVLLALVAAGSLLLLALVVRISLRRSATPTPASRAVDGAVREAATDLVTRLLTGAGEESVESATSHLAGLLDIDPARLRRAARSRRP